MSDPELLLRTLAPATVGGTGLVLLWLDRPLPLVQLGVAAFGMAGYVTLVDSAVPGNPLLGLFVMAVVASVLTHQRVVAVTLLGGVGLTVCGLLWHVPGTPINERMVTGFSATVAFAITTWLLHYLKRQSAAAHRRLQRLVESKDQFVATVSHELRTPLTSVVGLAHELHARRGDFTSEEVEEFTRLLVAESSDIADIVEDLLVAARSDLTNLALDTRSIDVTTVFESVIDEAAPGVLLESGEGDVVALADALRLRQIARNLVSNAVRYGGDSIRVTTSARGDTIRVEVRDDGPPLPADDRILIFDAYQRSGSVGATPGSVGLGLTVSRRLARLMGGDLSYSHDGTEAVFTLTLRRSPAASGVDVGTAA